MSSKTWKFLKEWGLFGNFLSALIIWAIGLLLTFINQFSAFKFVISFSIPLFVLIGIIVVLIGVIYFIYKFISNPVRQYITVFGYYRKLYHAEYYPYIIDGDRYYTKIKKSIEYRIARNGITTLSPFTFYAYKPRGANGEEVLSNIMVSALLNGQMNILTSEQSMIGTDGYSIVLRSSRPLKSGDLISFCVEYRQYGLHAVSQEELDTYKSLPDLPNTVRTRLVKEKNVEYVYASPSYSLKYIVEVIFPQDYPRKLLERVDDMAIISLSSKPLDKETMKKFASLSVTDNKITLEYKHEFRSAHGHFILWRLPHREELILPQKSGQLVKPLFSNPTIVVHKGREEHIRLLNVFFVDCSRSQ